MYLPPNLYLQRKFAQWAHIHIWLILAIALLVLAGWLMEVEWLKKMGSPVASMNPTTACCFLLFGISFLLLRSGRASLVTTAHLLLGLLILIALSRIAALMAGIDAGIDSILLNKKVMAENHPGRPSRMTFNTALSFFISAIGLLLIQSKSEKKQKAGQLAAFLLLLLALLSLISYLYQTQNFFGLINYIPMALNTAICFFLTGLVLLYCESGRGYMQHLTTTLSGSIAARVLLPAAILIPTLFGLIRLWGYWEGLYDNEFGVTLFSMVTIIVMAVIGWYTTIALNKRDLQQLQIQQELEDSKEEISAIFLNAPDAIVVIDREGRIVKWNPESERLFGWKREEVLHQQLADIVVPPELRDAHRKGLQRYLSPAESKIIGQTVDIWAVCKDGRHIDVALRISPFTLDNKGYFIGFIRDISEKKKTDKKLQQFNEELTRQVAEKTKEITDILERVTDGFIALDKEFRYTYANKKIGDLTNHDPSQLIGRNVWEVFPDAVNTPTYAAFMKAMQEQVYVSNTDHFEPLEIWQENHIYPSANGLSVFIRDISERKRAEHEITRMRSLSETLIDSLPGVFYFYDETGKFIRWNKQFEKVTGYSNEEIAVMHPAQFFLGADKEHIIHRIKQVFETGSGDAEACFTTKDGRQIPYFFKAVRMEYDGRTCLLGTGFDMTEKRKAEEDIKLSEQKYRLLFHSNPMPMWMLSLPEYKIIETNEATLRQYGYTREEFLSLDIFKLRPADDEDKLKRYTNRNFRGIHYAGVWRHQKKDGSILYVDITTYDTHYEGSPVRLVLGIDVTEQHLAEERLKQSYESIRELTEHLHNVREEERMHIAREIHDELGQLLTVLKMDVAWLNKKLSPGPGPVSDKIHDLLLLIDTTVKTVRRISSELRPSLLDDLGLLAAMEWHFEEFQKRSDIKGYCNLPDQEISLPDSVKIGFFRIFQESLTNVARHSGAKNVEVELQKNENRLILTIKDDGIGFDTGDSKRKTLGLIGMRERAEGMGGEYCIEGEPGRGTTVKVSVPLPLQELKTE
ncbi:MAG: PAS domain S-box protein [Chitinophagaceae bacterium]|nr:PAS domain S-box protein [Chitinophagaceae bacterium]